MNIIDILDFVTNKKQFDKIETYIEFCSNYLAYVDRNIQAKIVSQNENHYQFFQYDNWGNYQITRPINSKLFYSANDFELKKKEFLYVLNNINNQNNTDAAIREVINSSVYTLQQSIGAALDALPPGESNKARKINGDLFEQLIRLIIRAIGIDCVSGTVKVPVTHNDINMFSMNYQHDMIVKVNNDLKVLGTIKTSSKDRLDKIFIDKFLYSKLTDSAIPHIAIILNDVQRKNTRRENEYGINATFLPGHFKGYTVKLNPLDGVYYCDIRPNMINEPILKDHIKQFDSLILDDIWKFV